MQIFVESAKVQKVQSKILKQRHSDKGKIIVVQKQIKQLISIKREKKMRVVPFERKKDQVKRTK